MPEENHIPNANINFAGPAVNFRMPPQNLEAEMSVLGSVMIDPTAFWRVADVLSSGDFYRDGHRLLYETMIEIFEKHEPIDILSVSSRLREKGILEDVGGTSYLANLVNSVPSASNAGHYAEIVRKKAVLRDLIAASSHIAQLGYQEAEDVDMLLDEAERKILSVAKNSLRQNFINVKSALEEAWERIDKLHKNTNELRGVPTGFQELDAKLAGFQKSDLIVLAARPSVGKTALALDIARHVAIAHQIPVGIFSLEMSNQQLVDRFLAAEAHVDFWKIRTGRLSAEGDDFGRIRDALEKLSRAPIYIDDEASNNILQMRAMARRLQVEKGLGLIIVDYLQLMLPRNVSESMVQQITEISRSLKALARELDVPVLAISQLNRAVEQRHPPIPRLSDLRESGAIEQDADVVMLLYREDIYKEKTQRQNQVDVIIAKHRNGPTGKVSLYFNPEKVSFTDLADESSSL